MRLLQSHSHLEFLTTSYTPSYLNCRSWLNLTLRWKQLLNKNVDTYSYIFYQQRKLDRWRTWQKWFPVLKHQIWSDLCPHEPSTSGFLDNIHCYPDHGIDCSHHGWRDQNLVGIASRRTFKWYRDGHSEWRQRMT